MKFEIADWQNDGAVDKAKASMQAQADALGIVITEQDLAQFDAMATAVTNMLTALGVTSDSTVYLAAQSDSQPTGLTLNLGFRITYPQ